MIFQPHFRVRLFLSITIQKQFVNKGIESAVEKREDLCYNEKRKLGLGDAYIV